MKSTVIPLVSPEMELLLCCVRPTITRSTSERMAALVQAGLDWDRVVYLATEHAVKPLLYWRLKTVLPHSVPALVLLQLHDDFVANSRRNVFLMRKLLLLLELFATHDIRVLPFKGPILAATVYKNLALRRSGDLDIVVHAHDAARAQALLLEQGYELRQGLSQPLPPFALKDACHHGFVGDSVYIELHWAFIDRLHALSLTLDAMTARCSAVCVASKPVLVFAPENLLLLLCVHGMKHYWERLSWVTDIAWLLATTPNLDWARVFAYSDQFHVKRIVLSGLSLTYHLLGTNLPDVVIRRMEQDRYLPPLTAQIQERLVAAVRRPSGLKKYSLYMLARERTQDQLIYLYHPLRALLAFSVTPNDHDFTFLPLPKSLALLYYLVRPIRVVYEYRRLVDQARRWCNR